jgi:hypothetical protein
MERCKMTAHGTAWVAPWLLAAMLGGLPGAAAAEDGAPEPRACLPHASIKKTQVIDGRNIVFVARDGTHYVNELARQCPSMRRNSLLNYSIANGQICAGAMFVVMWEAGLNRVPAFTCQLGLFLPRTEDEVADLIAITSESRKSRRRTGRDMIEVVPLDEASPPVDAPEAESP